MAKGKRGDAVPRPLKSSDYQIVFITTRAARGWTDAVGQFRNAVADAWDALTSHPTEVDGQRVYALDFDLAYGMYAGKRYRRYQYKLSDAARIWYFVDDPGKRVLLELVSVGHPKATE